MPNWVRNTVNIIGDEADVTELQELLARPWESKNEKFVGGEFIYEDFVVKPTAISFHNLIPCPNDETYHTRGGTGTNPDGWYAWNSKHWGTKWDASDDQFHVWPSEYKMSKGNNNIIQLCLTFETAWSPPIPIYNALAKECLERGLVLEVVYCEEQGWGGRFLVDEHGVTQEDYEWDIPGCHEEYANNPYVGECICEWEDDLSLLFDDCPRYEAPAVTEEATV